MTELRVRLLVMLIAVAAIGLDVAAQGRGTTSARPAGRAAAAPPVPTIEPAMVDCPSVLGSGALTRRTYCDVLVGNDASTGIIINLPPHRGPVTLMFDLHNRHTYSQDLVKARKAYARYTARIGILSLTNHLLSRFVVSNEFRTEADLFDRVGGGSGPGGLKAVAPTGVEAVTFVVPEEHEKVSILGERLHLSRMDDQETFATPGRPIALISNVRVEYVPAPAPATAKPRR
jgi:hypothetical protein